MLGDHIGLNSPYSGEVQTTSLSLKLFQDAFTAALIGSDTQELNSVLTMCFQVETICSDVLETKQCSMPTRCIQCIYNIDQGSIRQQEPRKSAPLNDSR